MDCDHKQDGQIEALLKEIREKIKHRSLPPLISREFINVHEVQQTAPNSAISPCHINDREQNEDGVIEEAPKEDTIRIFQWNILAQALCQGDDDFVMCPVAALDWENRQLRILEEILRYDASIYCLQEVDCFSFLKEYFAKLNFRGVFHPKPDSPCLDQAVHTGPDGCAVFYNAKKFQLLNTRKIDLRVNNCVTNQVAILCKFAFIGDNSRVFYVAVTHLKARSGYEKLRQAQGRYLLNILAGEVSDHPLILTGDFNAPCSEPVYREIINSDLALSSAYTFLSEKKEEPAFTTWQIRGGYGGNKETRVTIDYIWFSKNHLKVKSVLAIPRDEDIGETRLPSFVYPSDHLSLVSDLQFI